MKITGFKARDIRFPTKDEIGDAKNKNPDYSAAMCILETDTEHEGHGLAFTIGRGNEVCVAAINSLAPMIVGKNMSEFTADMGKFQRFMEEGDSQLRWIGPQKGAIHLATAAVINAVWDLWGKQVGKPVWRIVADLSPEERVKLVDFSSITDAITPEEALEIFKAAEDGKGKRVDEMLKTGYPAYVTSAGWLGLSDEVMKVKLQAQLDQGMTFIKMKVGADVEEDKRRLTIAREMMGDDKTLMIDANQVWEVDQAIEWVKELAPFKPLFIEEPISPDDVLGHRKVAEGVRPLGIGVATGEMCMNKVLFKQFIMHDALDFVQIDSTRLAGPSEVLAVLLMAHKYKKPVCPHAGGVGLCEMVPHLSMIDYVCVSCSHEGRVLEFVDHLHEHFKDPCVVKGGRYMGPTAPGYNTEMYAESLDKHSFPSGEVWKAELAARSASSAGGAAPGAAAGGGGGD